ncbi:MAG: ATP-binding cassette domain-containing protein [Malacoplasma sp.]
MIQTIFLKKTNTLDVNDCFEINFSRNVNIIIGPKGGGKSTLFYLLAGLKKDYISKTVIAALAHFNLEFIKAKKFNGEEQLIKTLNKKTKVEMEEDLKSRNDVIFQDDPIKKDINNSSEIEKQKNKYLIEVIESDPKIKAFINDVRSIYEHAKTISQLSEKNINWANFFKIKKSLGKSDVLVKLNYSDENLIKDIDSEITNINKIIDNNNKQIREYENFKNFPFNKIYHDPKFEEIYNADIREILIRFDSINKLLKQRNQHMNSIKKMGSIFKNAYDKNIEKIKEDDPSNTIKVFIEQSKEYFAKTAREMVIIKKLFSKFITADFKLRIENNTPKELSHHLSYKLNDEINFTQDMLYKILIKILPAPDTKNDLSKWLKSTCEKGVKTEMFEEDKIVDEISNLIKDEIIVLANGKNYDHMSLGEKSIYGIQYKFERSQKNDLFLDQPEDNLDNHTIAENILELIKSKKDSQTIIVTHNANIGIITQPETIIVADLHSKNANPYSSECLIKGDSKESSSVYYLEGGVSYLEKRFKIILGEK